MRPHLSLYLFILLITPVLSQAQVYHSLPYITSPTTIAGNTVSVTSILGAVDGSHCNLNNGYWPGNPNNSGFRYNFSLPVSHLRLRIVAIDSAEYISVAINGMPYTLSKNEVSPIPPALNLTCSPQTADSIENGLLTTHNANTSTVGQSAQLDINPGIQIYEFEVIHSQPSGGSGSVYLIEFVNDTCATYSVTATANTPCEGETLTLTGSTVPGGTYAWFKGIDSLNDQLVYSKSPVALADSVYYTFRAIRGNCKYYKTIKATVKPIPAITGTTSNSPICPGATLQLSTDAITGATYSWGGPDNFSASIQNPDRINTNFQHQGKYWVSATVNGCTSIHDTVNVTMVTNTVTPTAGNNGPVCPGGTVNLTASTVPGATSYVWIGPNFTSTSQNPTIPNVTFADSGKYYVSAVVNGCQSFPDSTTVKIEISTPTPDATDTIVACPATSAQLSAGQLIPGASYTWIGPNFYSLSPNPTITNINSAHAGKYYVTATVNGCTSYPDSTELVVDITTPTPDADSAIVVCPGTAMNLNVANVPNATYSWTGPAFTSPSPLQNPSVPNATYGFAGTYYVTATVNGCTSRPDSTIVVVKVTTPTPETDSVTIVCPNTTLHLNASNVPGATYSWTGPGFTAQQQNPTRPNATGNYAGKYFVTADINGCISLPDSTMVVVEITTPTPEATGNGPLCRGASLELAATEIAGASYSWKGPDNYTSNNRTPVINPTTETDSGTYIVTANIAGCVSIPDTVHIAFKPMPDIISVHSNSPVCEGDSIELVAKGYIHSDGVTFTWSGPGGFVSGPLNVATVPNVSKQSEGTYTITATYDGCTSPAKSIDVVVKPRPEIPLATSNSATKDSARKAGQTLMLYGTSPVPGVSYSWTGPGGFTSDDQNPVLDNVSKLHEGIFTLTTTFDGCSSSAETMVYISTRNYVTLYPNPNKGKFTLKASLTKDQQADAEIVNIMGQVMHRDKVEVKGKLLLKDFSMGENLANGVYILRVPLEEDDDIALRFIISR